MKKKQILIIMLAFVLMMILIGCKKSNFGVVSNDNNTMVITAVNAAKKSFGGSGFITVEDGQKIVIDSSLNDKGEISLKFSAGPATDIGVSQTELFDAVSGANAVLEVSVKGSGLTEYEIEPGDYGLYAEVISKSNGTINISVK